jgi:FdhD protein
LSSRSIAKRVVHKVDERGIQPRSDRVVAEEPLEIRVRQGADSRTAAVTMRTPGADFELAAGFLFSEGIVRDRAEIQRIDYCSDVVDDQLYNVVSVHVGRAVPVDLQPLDRHFHTTSACGVCGKTSIEAIETRGVGPVQSEVTVRSNVLTHLPDTLSRSQQVFGSTGGLHAAGFFTATGELIAAREDVGRHNAVDKVVGWALLDGRVSLSDAILVVSGRASFEIVQKAAVAGTPVVCAVSAPTSLAVETAERFGITLVGFLRGERFNIYTGPERIAVSGA